MNGGELATQSKVSRHGAGTARETFLRPEIMEGRAFAHPTLNFIAFAAP